MGTFVINTTTGLVEVCLFGNVTLIVLNNTSVPVYAGNKSIMLNITWDTLNATLPECNLSKSWDGEGGKKKVKYDHVGALEYILATVMVYSLMGIVSMLLMRIAKRANRAKRRKEQMHENVTRYIKYADALQKVGEQETRLIQVIKVRAALAKYDRSQSEDSQGTVDVDRSGTDTPTSLTSDSARTDEKYADISVTMEHFRTSAGDVIQEYGAESDTKTTDLHENRHEGTCIAILHNITEESENEEKHFLEHDL